MHIALVDLGVVEDSLGRLVSTAEEVLAMLLKASMGYKAKWYQKKAQPRIRVTKLCKHNLRRAET